MSVYICLRLCVCVRVFVSQGKGFSTRVIFFVFDCMCRCVCVRHACIDVFEFEYVLSYVETIQVNMCCVEIIMV